ncbi:MAG TPA: serine/threonine-protein kinase, partial [Kofleriaceae bacterium]|nr:serine/threonine-protein kinase [Kofleriaceae bacterium]
GGMGTVYRAYDPDLDRNVALKLVRADPRNPDHRARLRSRLWREAQTLAQLAHPNVVAVHDVGTHDDRVFVAMELVDGTTLRELLTDERPALPRILELFRAAGGGLAAAHDVALIHRDFKPDNVLVGRDGRVRVVDFGLARAVAGEDSLGPLAIGSDATVSGLVAGTPAYMAPEQFAGAELDARADQFSFCVALHEALFGARPADERAPIPLRTPGGTRVPTRLRAALLRGLAPDPASRHSSMHALLDELAPSPGRRRIAAGVAAAATAVAAVLAVHAIRADDPAARCEGLDARLTGVWDPPRRAAIGQAIGRHGDAEAAAIVQRVLDGYTASWLAMHTASCRATRVLGEQSAELLDLRTQCLDRRLAEVRYLTGLLLEADAGTAARAVTSVRTLPPIDDCANATALRDPLPPANPLLAAPLRDQLARVRAELSLGKYDDTARDAAALAASASAAGDPWLEASATYLAARAERQLGHIPRAEDGLYRAIAIAETGRASDVVADAWMALAWIAAEDRDRYADALRLAGVAGGVVRRLGGNPRLEATLEDYLGVLRLDRNELDVARQHLERGLALREKLYGPTHDETARSLQHVAFLEESAGNLAKALDLHHRARTIAEAELGPHHPDVLAMLSSEGAALFKLERHAEAAALLTDGLARAERATGPTSELTASFLTNLGLAQGQVKHHADARAAFERSFAIHVHNDGPDSLDAGTLHIDLAFLLIDTSSFNDARAHAERAVAIFDRILGANHPDLAMALEALATTELRTHHPERAVIALERAVTIRATAPATPPQDLAATRFDLAKAILAAHGSPTRARKLAADARTALERIGDTDGVREVSSWLASLR